MCVSQPIRTQGARAPRSPPHSPSHLHPHPSPSYLSFRKGQDRKPGCVVTVGAVDIGMLPGSLPSLWIPSPTLALPSQGVRQTLTHSAECATPNSSRRMTGGKEQEQLPGSPLPALHHGSALNETCDLGCGLLTPLHFNVICSSGMMRSCLVYA